jgi:hypothetical protein
LRGARWTAPPQQANIDGMVLRAAAQWPSPRKSASGDIR